MSASFTVPESMIGLVEERPLLKVIMDVNDSVTVFNNGLAKLAYENKINVLDNDVDYIFNALVSSAISPHASSFSTKELVSFFDPGAQAEVARVIDETRWLIYDEVSRSEREVELLVGQPIYPTTSITPMRCRENRLAVVNYHTGHDPLQPNDEAYPDLDPETRTMVEELDFEESETIVDESDN